MTPFHAVLAANRSRYNAQFRLAKHRAKQLDASAFLVHLQKAVGPAVDAAAAAGANPVAVTDTLIDLALATHGRPPEGLQLLLPELARFVAEAPKRVPMAMANALHHLESAPDGDPDSWVLTMIEASKLAPTVEALLDVGAVAAWRYGLALLRPAALEAARRVKPDLLAPVLGTSDVDSLAADPWLAPGVSSAPKLQVVRRVGKFRGFGGTFARPPRVFAAGGLWHANDGKETWRVHADRFGTDLRRVAHVKQDAPQPGLTMNRSGGVQYGKESLHVPELVGATSWVSIGNALAATTPWTHAITFVARTP